MLSRLIYTSRASSPFSINELRDLIDLAITKNHVSQITGMLCYIEGRFLQVLEGERESIADTLGRLYLDPRHHDICVICAQDIEQREFSSWHMGYAELNKETFAVVEKYLPDQRIDERTLNAGTALELLLDLRAPARAQTAELLALSLRSA